MQLSFLRAVKAYAVFLLSFVLFFTTGCEDDDHDNHDHGHTDADGFILENESGTEVYREFEGAVTGTVTLSVGDTLELAVHFLDHEGNEIEHEEEEEGEHEEGELEVSGSNASIAIVEVEHEEEGDDHDHDHDHEEEHGAALHIIGVSSGTTSFTLQLMHDGHADYTSTNDVTVTVN